MNNIALELLSAGVIAALVTGIFSLIVAIKNNKRLIKLETIKQEFTIKQDRFNSIKEAYNELITLIPEDKHLEFSMSNLSSKENIEEEMERIIELAEKNIKIMFFHFQKYGYLFVNKEQEKINNMIEEIDDITLAIRNGEAENNGLNKLLAIINLEKEYFKIHKDNLSELCKNS